MAGGKLTPARNKALEACDRMILSWMPASGRAEEGLDLRSGLGLRKSCEIPLKAIHRRAIQALEVLERWNYMWI